MISKYGGNGVDIRLTSVANTSQVFWSHKHNSYVIVEDEKGEWSYYGKRVALLSINGIGEIRWRVTEMKGSTEGDTDAVHWFNLRRLVEWDLRKIDRLDQKRTMTMEDGQPSFTFEGLEFDVRYAGYFIEHVRNELKQKGHYDARD